MKRINYKIINLSLILLELLLINDCSKADEIDLTDYIYNKNYNLYDYVIKKSFESNGEIINNYVRYIKIDENLDSLINYDHDLNVSCVSIIDNDLNYRKIYDMYFDYNGYQIKPKIIDSIHCDYREDETIFKFEMSFELPNLDKMIGTLTSKIEFIKDTLIDNTKQNVVKIKSINDLNIIKSDNSKLNYMNLAIESYYGLNGLVLKDYLGTGDNINNSFKDLKETSLEIEYIPINEFEYILLKAGK